MALAPEPPTMIHPIFRLIASRPQMLADHVEAYSELVAEEVGSIATGIKLRAIFGVVALAAAGVALVLIGVSAMLWAVVPVANMPAPWALIVVPAIPLLVVIGCYIGIRSAPPTGAFKLVREQFAADVAMMHEVGGAR